MKENEFNIEENHTILSKYAPWKFYPTRTGSFFFTHQNQNQNIKKTIVNHTFYSSNDSNHESMRYQISPNLMLLLIVKFNSAQDF